MDAKYTPSRIVFLSFADKRYAGALNSLKECTEHFPFDERYFLNEDDLPADYLRSLHCRVYRRGFGYWRWKPYLIRERMNLMNEGDILVYTDAGVYWNAKGMKRFEEYIQMLKDGEFLITFQSSYLEKDYSKGDILKFTGHYNDDNVLMSLQLLSGIVIIKKNAEGMRFVEDWYELCHHHFNLISDKVSVVPCIRGFVENRHDQSALSLLAKQRRHIEISYKETLPLSLDWSQMEAFPIQARQYKKKKMTWKEKHIFELKKPYMALIAWYLKRYKHFYFSPTTKVYW